MRLNASTEAANGLQMPFELLTTPIFDELPLVLNISAPHHTSARIHPTAHAFDRTPRVSFDVMSAAMCVPSMAAYGSASRSTACSATGRGVIARNIGARKLPSIARVTSPTPSRGSRNPSTSATGQRGAAEPPAPEEGFGVVITGGTKGVGYAMAREFLQRGDRVCVCGRSQTRVDAAVKALRLEFPGQCISGTACDVTDPRDVDKLGDYATSTVGTIHHWLNNAGMVSARESLLNIEPSEVVQVCNTNLTGAILCCQKAVKIMTRQQSNSDGSTTRSGSSSISMTNQSQTIPFHVYNFGFSKWGASFSKSTCTHKATKRGLSQLTVSLTEELKAAGINSIGVHQLSPGMVLTDLLLEGAEPVSKRFFNVLAEEPETVAADLVPKIRGTFSKTSSVEFLTLPDAVFRVVTGVPAILGGGKFFDSDGNRITSNGSAYKPNGTRLLYEEMK